MTALPHQAISISYKKLVHDLDLQVSIMGGLDKVHIWKNEMDSAQSVSQDFSSTVILAMLLSEELPLIRHLGAGGEEICSGKEDSSRGSTDTALCIDSFRTAHHGKTPYDSRRHSLGLQTVCTRMRAHVYTHARTHTHEEGEAKHVRTCYPSPRSIRPSMTRHHPLVSQLHSYSSESKALTENQDTGRNHHSFVTSSFPKPTAQQAPGRALR